MNASTYFSPFDAGETLLQAAKLEDGVAVFLASVPTAIVSTWPLSRRDPTTRVKELNLGQTSVTKNLSIKSLRGGFITDQVRNPNSFFHTHINDTLKVLIRRV